MREEYTSAIGRAIAEDTIWGGGMILNGVFSAEQVRVPRGESINLD